MTARRAQKPALDEVDQDNLYEPFQEGFLDLSDALELGPVVLPFGPLLLEGPRLHIQLVENLCDELAAREQVLQLLLE